MRHSPLPPNATYDDFVKRENAYLDVIEQFVQELIELNSRIEAYEKAEAANRLAAAKVHLDKVGLGHLVDL